MEEKNQNFISFFPIGVIHTSFTSINQIPIQSQSETAKLHEGYVEIFPEFVEGLKDLSDFSHIYLFYYFNQSKTVGLTVNPFLDTQTHGVFATRAPSRPNKLGFSLVELIEVKKNILYIKGIDILDNSPLIDIKPFVPNFDTPKDKTIRIGWLNTKIQDLNDTFDDGRFRH